MSYHEKKHSSRSFRLYLSITDDKGRTKGYQIKPDRPGENEVFRLTLAYLGDVQPTLYHVIIDCDGIALCDCPGFLQYHRCKHVSALTAANYLDVTGWVARLRAQQEFLDEREHQYEQRIAELERQAAEARATLEAARAKRRRKPQAKPSPAGAA